MRTRKFWISVTVLLILAAVSPLVISAESLDSVAYTIINANPQLSGQAFYFLQAAKVAAQGALQEERSGNMAAANQMINMAVQDYNNAVNMQSQ